MSNIVRTLICFMNESTLNLGWIQKRGDYMLVRTKFIFFSFLSQYCFSKKKNIGFPKRSENEVCLPFSHSRGKCEWMNQSIMSFTKWSWFSFSEISKTFWRLVGNAIAENESYDSKPYEWTNHYSCLVNCYFLYEILKPFQVFRFSFDDIK